MGRIWECSARLLWHRAFRGRLLLQLQHLDAMWKRQQVCVLRRNPSHGEDVQAASRHRHQHHVACIHVKILYLGDGDNRQGMDGCATVVYIVNRHHTVFHILHPWEHVILLHGNMVEATCAVNWSSQFCDFSWIHTKCTHLFCIFRTKIQLTPSNYQKIRFSTSNYKTA